MISRKLRTSLPIGANFYPFTTMAIIEDLNKRLTLHTAQPLGIGSLEYRDTIGFCSKSLIT
jgi:alpha-mannosidase II